MCFIRHIVFLFSISAFICTFLPSCMVGPDFKRPHPPQVKAYTRLPMPQKTVGTRQKGNATQVQYWANGKNIPAEWWSLFHSQAINNLVEQGLANNPSLAIAKAALRQAQETVNAQIGASLYPALSAQLNISRAAFSNSTFGIAGSNTFNLFNPAFNIAYTLDIFGGARREIEALCAQVHYQTFELEAAYLTLTSNIVTTAVNIAALRYQIKATHELIAAQEKTLRLVQQQFHLGGASGADVLTQQTQLSQTQASLPPLEQNLAKYEHLLAILIGNFPSENPTLVLNLDYLQLPRELPLSLPSTLVQQRPDIRAAEALLHAASAQIGVATANLFPQITLNGSYGWQKNNPANLFSSPNVTWNIATQIIQPIFNGSSLQAKRRAAIAGFEQAYAQYRQTVLQAFQNVADSLRAIENDAKIFRDNFQAETSAKDSLIMSHKQFRLGSISYLSLLNAERQYQQIKISRIQAQAARYNDTVALFQSLGGGWWNKEHNGPSAANK